ncbi:MAG: hypothetical protein ABEJ44_06560 [Halanaeroarchaeum sp.]
MTDDPVYVARPLLEGLLEYARDEEPGEVSVAIATRPAGDLQPTDGPDIAPAELPSETPVFADFSFPGAGGAVNRVFGVDLGRPAGSTQGRFVSHPRGDPTPSTTDDFAPRLLVAVPPWTVDTVRVSDRNGRRFDLRTVAGESPEDTLANLAEGL